MESARRAIQRSEEEASGARDALHDEVGGEFGFTLERLAMSNSSTALLIGNGSQAEASARRALELVSARPPEQRSAPVMGGAAADLALARLLEDDLEGAAEALATVLAIPSEHRVTGLVTRAAQVRRLLAQPRFHGQPLAADLGEQIELFTRLSARQLTPSPVVLALEA